VTILDAFAGEEAEQSVPPKTIRAIRRLGSAKTPLQVQIVDLLQALRFAPFVKRPFKVAVIVSAWTSPRRLRRIPGWQ